MGPMKATQLILNPRFADNAKTWYPANYQATGNPTLSVHATNLTIARTSDAGQQWASTKFATKPGKEYVVAVVSVSFEGEFLNGRSVAVTDKQNTSVIGALAGVAHGMNSFRFTASEDEANLRLYASSGAETMWKEPMVVASDEWEWLQSGNIDYFDYSLMPDPRGGGGIPPSVPAHVVRRSFWGLAA